MNGWLPTAEVVDALAPQELPAFMAELAALALRAAARLATVPTIAPLAAKTRAVADDLVGAEEAARIARRSVSWIRKRGHTLNGFCQPGGRGTRAAWSRAALEAWAAPVASDTANGI